MKQQLEIRLLARFVGAEYETYSITQLARSAQAGYAHAHTTVTRLLDDGILTSRQIGRMKFCSPDLNNDKTRALLSVANAERKAATLATANLRNLDENLRALLIDEASILAIILQGETITIIVAEHGRDAAILKRTAVLNIAFRTPDEYRRELKKDSRRDAIVLHGYDRYLLLLLPIAEQLLLNHGRLLRKGVKE